MRTGASPTRACSAPGEEPKEIPPLPCRFWRCLGLERFTQVNSIVALAIISISTLATLRKVSTYTGLFQGTSSALGRDRDETDPEHESKGVFRDF